MGCRVVAESAFSRGVGAQLCFKFNDTIFYFGSKVMVYHLAMVAGVNDDASVFKPSPSFTSFCGERDREGWYAL